MAPRTIDLSLQSSGVGGILRGPLLPDLPPSKPVVSFVPYVFVATVMNSDQYSNEEFAACWYTREDLRMINAELRTTLLLMGDSQCQHYLSSHRQQESDDGTNINAPQRPPVTCTRGLEASTSPGRERKKYNRQEALNAVLNEQEYQTRNLSHNPEALAAAYFAKTMESRGLARVLGLADQEFVAQEVIRREDLLSFGSSFQVSHQRNWA